LRGASQQRIGSQVSIILHKRLAVSIICYTSMDNTNEDAVVIDTEDEEATSSNEDSEEETVDLADELEKAREANRDINARAKRAEDELKQLRKSTPPSINNDPQLSEELKLIARGLSDEEIEHAKVIAKGRGIALTEAIKDSLFLTYQSDLNEKKERENAKLGASKGSGESKNSSDIRSGMSRDEHEKAFNKLMSK